MEDILIFLLGIATYLFIVWSVFADFIKILIKIIPMKPPQDYHLFAKTRNCPKFKQHKKKWVWIYLSLLIIYMTCYFCILFLTGDSFNGFLIAFVVLIFSFGLTNYFERKKR